MKQSHGLVNHSSRIFFLAVVAIGATLFALRSIALARGVHAWSLSTANHNQRNRIQTPVIQNQGLISCSYWTRQRSIVLSGVAREKMDGVSINVGGGVGEWDPVAQIYIGGKVPEDGSAVQEMIDRNGGYLRIFGYGSLCWNPGAPGESALAHPSVTNTTGKALGYRRVWAQKSTDHRGSPKFPGIVCTLITEKEYRDVVTPESKPDCVHDDVDDSLTEGLIYTVPPEFVDVCLDELDFREKGGYAREVIDVVEDQTGETVQALLYRGTPENPAFWRRALRDLPFAAAVIASASGPSGENHVYLNRLDTFLEHVSSCPTILRKFDHTFQLTAMASHLRHESYQLNFLCGSGSNQHNQLLLQSDDNAAELDNNGEETHEFKEIAMCTATQTNNKEGEFDSIQHDPIIGIYAGGGHCGILSQAGRLFLCGWNSAGQLGTSEVEHKQFPNEQNAGKLRFFHVMHELADICVETASFGFAHTLVVEAGTKRLFCFGDNSRGQVNGAIQKDKLPDSSRVPVTPSFLVDEQMSAIGAGVFHSAAVSTSGELFTFGCGRYGQSLSNHLVHDGVSIGRWSPGDGSKLLKVVCGQRHTVVLDDRGRVWTFGDNRYFQLGRQIATSGNDARFDATPKLVDLGSLEYSCVDINCGWSHSVVRVTDSSQRVWVLGWGRNDKGQLGTVSPDNVNNPTRVFSHVSGIQVVSCGSESTSVVDQDDLIFSCGWNEHGNLGTGNTSDCFKATPATGAPVTYTPRFAFNGVSRLTVAAGGAHLIAMRVSTPT